MAGCSVALGENVALALDKAAESKGLSEGAGSLLCCLSAIQGNRVLSYQGALIIEHLQSGEELGDDELFSLLMQ